MKKILMIFAALAVAVSAKAQQKTVLREYTYIASPADSKATSRTFAIQYVREDLLREIGEFLQTEQTLDRRSVMKNGKEELTEDYSKKTTAITAGIVEMKVLDEFWSEKNRTYYIEAQMTVDPKEVSKRIAEVLNDKQKTKDLEESRKRTLAAEAEAERLRKELAQEKNKNNIALKQTYQRQADALSAEEYLIRANNASESGFYDLAIEYLQKAISIDPNFAWAYNDMGDAYADLGNYKKAISSYEKAISIDPNFAAAYNNMGVAYADFGNHKKAISNYQKAISINPNDAIAYNNMGNAYGKLKNHTQAFSCYQKAVSIDPNYATAYYSMGLAYAKLRKHAQAISCLQKAVSIDPNDAEAYYLMGLAYTILENDIHSSQGVSCFQKAARLGHEDAQEILKKDEYTW